MGLWRNWTAHWFPKPRVPGSNPGGPTIQWKDGNDKVFQPQATRLQPVVRLVAMNIFNQGP